MATRFQLYDDLRIPHSVQVCNPGPERIYVRICASFAENTEALRELKAKLIELVSFRFVIEVWEMEFTLPADMIKATSNCGMHCNGARYKYGHDYGNYVYSAIWNLMYCFASQHHCVRLVRVMDRHIARKPSLALTYSDTESAKENKGDKIEVLWAIARRADLAADWSVEWDRIEAHEWYRCLQRICELVTHMWIACQKPYPVKRLKEMKSTDFSSLLFHAMRRSDATTDFIRIVRRLYSPGNCLERLV